MLLSGPGLGIETESVSKHNVRFVPERVPFRNTFGNGNANSKNVPERFWKRERFLKTRFETQKSFLSLNSYASNMNYPPMQPGTLCSRDVGAPALLIESYFF